MHVALGRRGHLAVAMLSGLVVVAAMSAGPALGAPGSVQPSAADLDGKPLALADVGKWFCEDFDRTVIHCYSTAAGLEAAVHPELLVAATTSVTYVIVYENATWQGAYMYMADDYPILGLIGWNDRISSYIVVNGGSGKFWSDWWYGGTGYYFCCNSSVSYVGASQNDIYSSVFHY